MKNRPEVDILDLESLADLYPDPVDRLTAAVAVLAAQIKAEKEAKRSARQQLAVALVAIVALAVYGWWSNNARIDDVIAARTESRVAACTNNQKFAEAHNKLVLGIATGAGTREIPPALQPAVDEQLVAVPDCSPQGIVDFYERHDTQGDGEG